MDGPELIEVWWNGRWRLARRDVYLRYQPERWVVEARDGGPAGTSRTWEYDSETDARTMVRRCIDTGGGGWRETTGAYRTQQQMRDHRPPPTQEAAG